MTGRQSENVRAKLKRLEDRGWLRRTPAGKFTLAPELSLVDAAACRDGPRRAIRRV